MSTTNRKKIPAHALVDNDRSADVRREHSIVREIKLLVFLGVCILLFLGNFGLAGVGDTGINWISNRFRGLIGVLEYIMPVFMFISALYLYANPGNRKIRLRVGLSAALGVVIIVFIQFLYGRNHLELKWKEYFEEGMSRVFCGGAIGGKIASLLYSILGLAGGILVLILLAIIICVVLTEKSFLAQVSRAGHRGSEALEDNFNRNRQRKNIRRNRAEVKKAVKINYDGNKSGNESRKSANGMSLITLDNKKKTPKKNIYYDEEMHELFADNSVVNEDSGYSGAASFTIQQNGQTHFVGESVSDNETGGDSVKGVGNTKKKKRNIKGDKEKSRSEKEESYEELEKINEIKEDFNNDRENALYVKPSLDLLKKNTNKFAEKDSYLREMGITLQKTLQSFGVNVTIVNVSCGPSVTRYELQPEKGIKVSKITNLADDIKLNLAVSDIRIEAPIPGKAAVGIEVPNRTASPVLLRELLESQSFQNSASPLTFAVGKDISGNIVVGDIAKMPHLLVAGATGSGKSVCINTIIMSLLYKAEPKDVKLILIDPKVVELSIYNGIPHMFIPVVTDPKKAAGALNWAVAEMDDRYNKMSEMGVRDLEGYNEKIALMNSVPIDGEEKPEPFSRLVIIVDELADLMMVCGKEVEDAICRLAQKARAAGIHLILATQRPSVDVITGLIKANMPSRIAFAVSSGVDSRTIIDIHGAEKLLGKGDMLFYPSGYPKPVRVQGAFVSDKEVSDVVEFLSSQNKEEVSAKVIEERMNVIASSGIDNMRGSDGYDEYFVQAGNFVIEKGKASTSMIQRVFKVGFNRAARIVSQLEEAGVVGPEEGTKPRKVIMSEEEFNQFVEESV